MDPPSNLGLKPEQRSKRMNLETARCQEREVDHPFQVATQGRQGETQLWQSGVLAALPYLPDNSDPPAQQNSAEQEIGCQRCKFRIHSLHELFGPASDMLDIVGVDVSQEFQLAAGIVLH